MKARTASVLAWSVLGLSVLMTAAGWWLAALNVGTPIPEALEDVSPGSDALLLLGLLPFSVVGSLIVARRPGNPIGSTSCARRSPAMRCGRSFGSMVARSMEVPSSTAE